MFVYSPISKCSILTVGLLSAGLLGGCPAPTKDCVGVNNSSGEAKITNCFKCVKKNINDLKSPAKSSGSAGSKTPKSEVPSDKTTTINVDLVTADLFRELQKHATLAKTVFNCALKKGENGKDSLVDSDEAQKLCVHGALAVLKTHGLIEYSEDSTSFACNLKTIQEDIKNKIKDLPDDYTYKAELNKMEEELFSDGVVHAFLENADNAVDGQEKDKFRVAMANCGAENAGDKTFDADGKLFAKWLRSSYGCIKTGGSPRNEATSPFICCDSLAAAEGKEQQSGVCCTPIGGNQTKAEYCCSAALDDQTKKCVKDKPSPPNPNDKCANCGSECDDDGDQCKGCDGARCCYKLKERVDNEADCCSGLKEGNHCSGVKTGDGVPLGATNKDTVCADPKGAIIKDKRCCNPDGKTLKADAADTGCCSGAAQHQKDANPENDGVCQDTLCAFVAGSVIDKPCECASGVSVKSECQAKRDDCVANDDPSVPHTKFGKKCCDVLTPEKNLVYPRMFLNGSAPPRSDAEVNSVTGRCSDSAQSFDNGKDNQGCVPKDKTPVTGKSTHCCAQKFKQSEGQEIQEIKKFWDAANRWTYVVFGRAALPQSIAAQGTEVKAGQAYSIVHKTRESATATEGQLVLKKMDEQKETGSKFTLKISWADSEKWSTGTGSALQNVPKLHGKFCDAVPDSNSIPK